jgi:hypothetical protein
MKYTIAIIILIISAFAGTAWVSEIQIISEPNVVNLQFGTDTDASDMFDPYIDVPFFSLPSGGYGYFFLNDSLHPDYTKLGTDFRFPTRDTIIWKFSLEGGFSGYRLNWDFSELPDSGIFEIGAYDLDSLPQFVVTEWNDMREIDSLNIMLLGGAIRVVGAPLSGINEREIPKTSAIQIAPNPFNSSVKIIIQNTEDRIIEIFDITGKCVDKIYLSVETGGVLWKPAENLPTGIYFIYAGETYKPARAILIR